MRHKNLYHKILETEVNMNMTEFNKLVNENKTSTPNRSWYFNLEGDWWHGMYEDEVRKRILLSEQGLKLNLGAVLIRKMDI